MGEWKPETLDGRSDPDPSRAVSEAAAAVEEFVHVPAPVPVLTPVFTEDPSENKRALETCMIQCTKLGQTLEQACGTDESLDIYRRRRKICIEVSNTCDLPDTAELDRLFDRFYRVDESRAAGTGGTGIGLAMAQAIAETHGGKIKAERTGGKAICFRVLL